MLIRLILTKLQCLRFIRGQGFMLWTSFWYIRYLLADFVS